MTEDDARKVLLVRAWEQGPGTPAWSPQDRHEATAAAWQALQAPGGAGSSGAVPDAAGVAGVGPDGAGPSGAAPDAAGAALVVTRARQAAERLVRRSPSARGALRAAVWSPAWLPAAAGIAFVAGFALDAVSAGQRINLLAPPILVTLAWNLLVYAGLAVAALRGRDAGAPAAAVGTAHPDEPGGAWARWSGLAARIGRRAYRIRAGTDGEALPEQRPVAEFARTWIGQSAPLTRARVLSMLHSGAAAFAFGAVAGLYVRGLAFEYRAGWQSTFLSPDAVSTIVHAVLTPASLLTGIALPDAAHLATLRAPAFDGENAAPWIHLYAVTVLLFILVPRLLLAWRAHRQAQRLAAAFPLPLDEAYYTNLRRIEHGQATRVRVAPYNFQPAGAADALRRLLGPVFEASIDVSMLPGTALGDDELPVGLSDRVEPLDLLVALFNASATPERETHGRFVQDLRQARPDAPLLALVDETAFRQRFADQPDRFGTREAAWRTVLQAAGGASILFCRLGESDAADPRAVRRAVDAARPGTPD